MTFLIKTAIFDSTSPAPFTNKEDGRNFVVDADTYDHAFVKVTAFLTANQPALARNNLDGEKIEFPIYDSNAEAFINASHAILEIAEDKRCENIRL